MISWIIGSIIVGLTVFIIVRTIVRLRRGESSCCGDCTQSQCNCHQRIKHFRYEEV